MCRDLGRDGVARVGWGVGGRGCDVSADGGVKGLRKEESVPVWIEGMISRGRTSVGYLV